jgi:thiol-disulfide isomerase/thioredoxin
MACAALLLALGVAIPGAGSRPVLAQPQDTIRVAGVALTPGDSAEARRLLRTDLGPTSRRWTRLQDSTKRFGAAKTLFQVARLAYPSGAWADSVLAFLREAGADHPEPEVRAEFLYAGLQVAESAERDQAQRQFYEQLAGDYEESHYAKEARRLFAPGSQVQAGKELPELQLPRLSDSTATFAKSDFEGKTFLIDFWGTWCPPCIRAMPHLHEAYRKHGGEDFTILSVAMRDTRAAVKQFRSQKWEMPWNHAFVPKGSDLQRRLRSRFNISSFPMAILVGPDGQILSVNRGAESGEKVAQAIREALAPAGDSGNASRTNTRSGATDPGGSGL